MKFVPDAICDMCGPEGGEGLASTPAARGWSGRLICLPCAELALRVLLDGKDLDAIPAKETKWTAIDSEAMEKAAAEMLGGYYLPPKIPALCVGCYTGTHDNHRESCGKKK